MLLCLLTTFALEEKKELAIENSIAPTIYDSTRFILGFQNRKKQSGGEGSLCEEDRVENC